ncbi:MAG: P-loop NTPase fold protein, partial [Rhodospirillales bacterium]|nr:P-loop NTPase fold protein [Rhodospirillales bacterium]
MARRGLEWFGETLKLYASLLFKEEAIEKFNLKTASLWTLGMVAAVLLLILRNKFRSIGLDTGRLLASVSGRFRVRSLSDQLGFRHKFSTILGDVARALAPRHMLIFVDDLDRCQPENVVETLEAINFVVSSGPSIVVMGMDRDWVEPCIKLRFENVAKEMSKGDGEAEVRDFAGNYLEKLINIEVPIPKARAKQTEALLEAAAGPAGEEGSGKLPRKWARAAAWIFMLAVLTLTGAGAGLWTQDLNKTGQSSSSKTTKTTSGGGSARESDSLSDVANVV